MDMKITRDKVNKYLSRIKSGEDCLVEFIDYTRGYIEYIAFKYLIDKSLVEDAVFLSYDKILRAIQSFDSAKSGLAWIVKITQNEAYKINQKETALDVLPEEYIAAHAQDEFRETDLSAKYDVNNAMSRLEEQERTVVEHRVFMDMTFRDIAKEMGLPKSTVAYIFKRALKKLEKFLE